MPETKTSVKAGVKTPVADSVSAENGKMVIEKTERGSFQASGLKEPVVSDRGGNLSEKAQELSPRQAVEKKSTLSNPSPMPETKTSVKAGVKTPVADPVSAENGKMVVEKSERGSFQSFRFERACGFRSRRESFGEGRRSYLPVRRLKKSQPCQTPRRCLKRKPP